ncbi:MAG: hypothetical protein U9N34_11330 [Candidatus Cloacimonadota bacterium]|nr:hypothetical protein [Candidatus Cloacimonadota bacterium]
MNWLVILEVKGLNKATHAKRAWRRPTLYEINNEKKAEKRFLKLTKKGISCE